MFVHMHVSARQNNFHCVHSYVHTRFMLSSLEPIKCMPFSRESVPKFGTLFLIRLKYLNVRPFVKKIKELLLNFLRSEDDYVEVSRLIKLFNTLG